MAYKGRFINPHRQHGKKGYTLHLEDDEGVLPAIRVDKSFREDVSDEEMLLEAQREVLAVVLPESVGIDKPKGE